MPIQYDSILSFLRVPTDPLGSQTVTPESLNRLVAVTSDDAQVIAVCGETKLDNEEGSWWTMIQV